MTAYQTLGDRVKAWRQRAGLYRPAAAALLSREHGIEIKPRQLERVEAARLTEKSVVVRVLARRFMVELPGVMG